MGTIPAKVTRLIRLTKEFVSMLTDKQRAELEALGAATVRAKLIQPGAGRGADLAGFKTGIQGGNLTRGDVEDWLAEKHVEEANVQNSTLRWAKIAGWAAIISVLATVVIGVIAIAVTVWLAK
jgi:hypothetical protein